MEKILAELSRHEDKISNAIKLLLSLAYKIASEVSADDSSCNELYLSVCNSVLFLRLICPAIISPLEWGVLQRSYTQKLMSVPSVADDSVVNVASSDDDYRLDMDNSFPALCILSRILSDSPLRRSIEAECTDEEISNVLCTLNEISDAKV